MTDESYETFRTSISRIGEAVAVDDKDLPAIIAGAQRLQEMPAISAGALEALVVERPEWIRVLGLVVGLSQESLLVTLSRSVGTRSYRSAARRASEVVAALDELGLLSTLDAQRAQTYSYTDILLARYSSRATAGRAIGRGRLLEDAVERVIEELRLPHQMRTSFVGHGGRTAPCDLAIPTGGPGARIVVGIKGFNSTGSKLTDARREIEEMALIRKPRQTVYAIVDGVGWADRQSDLRAIFGLWEAGDIDGLFTRKTLDDFRTEVTEAARVARIAPTTMP